MNNLEDEISSGSEFLVATFYCFNFLDEHLITSLHNELLNLANKLNVRGMVLVASEGINGTICGSQESIDSMVKLIEVFFFGKSLEMKFSRCSKQAFRKFRIRKKTEIVRMGIKDVNPVDLTGQYIEPADWNAYLDDPNTLVIDTRNDYEIDIGSFEGVLNPHTATFGEFPNWVRSNLRKIVNDKKPKRIAMFCTGGIRCEKATSYLKTEGFSGVTQLHGGILRYLEEVPESKSRWKGECFVFDRRVSLNHQLNPGVHRLCNACGMPLSPTDIDKRSYIRGIQCHYCENKFTEKDRARFLERQKHIDKLMNNSPGNTLWPNP